MSEALFGYGNLDEFRPMYGEVNWREAYERRMAERGEELPAPAWFEAEDNMGQLVEQLTQENFTIYINRTNPQMDVVSVQDPRDGVYILWTREELGEEFDKIIKNHYTEALVVSTKYPLKMIAEYVLSRVRIDIQHIEEEGLPEGWQNES